MRRRKGFTLIELLTVIVIILVIAALLMPTLARARREASVVKCESNLREMSRAFLIYTEDWAGRTPGGFSLTCDHAAGGYSWPHMLYTYLEKNPLVLRCPADRREPSIQPATQPAEALASYAYNMFLWNNFPYQAYQRGTSWDSILNASKLIVFCDDNWSTPDIGYRSLHQGDSLNMFFIGTNDGRHDGRDCAIAGDGHTMLMKMRRPDGTWTFSNGAQYITAQDGGIYTWVPERAEVF